MAARASTSPRASGIASGAVSGLVIFVVIVLVDHFLFSSRETRRYGLIATLLGAGIAGAVLGAIVGLIVVQTRSMPGAEWELRFGPDNRFRVFYAIDSSRYQVQVLAIGVKRGSRLIIGGEEVKL